MNLKTMANNSNSTYQAAVGGRYEGVSQEKPAAAVRKQFAEDMLRVKIERQTGEPKEIRGGLIRKAALRVADDTLVPGGGAIRKGRGPVYETLPIYYRQEVGGSAEMCVSGRIPCETDGAQKPDALTEAAAAQPAAKAEEAAGAAGRAEAEDPVEADDGKRGVMQLVVDSNSPFYQEMYQKMKLQLEQAEEEKEKQAIIDALDAILESLSAKKDDWRKKPDSVSSMAELSEVIDSLDRFDPRKEQLNLLRERLQTLGIYADLDVGVKDSDKTWETTLTQSLIREEAKDAEPSISDMI